MLDINFIRDNKDIVAEGAKRKHVDIDIDALIALDDKRRAMTQEVDELRAKQNSANDSIAKADGKERDDAIASMRILKEDLQTKEEGLRDVVARWRELMLQVPNVPDVSVPEGASAEDNVELKAWGTKPNFSFTPRSHVDVMTDLDMVEFERGTKVHGFRGYFLKNDGARLSFAIWQYAIDFFMKKGFDDFVIAPTVLKKQLFYGTGHLPNDVDDIYRTQDDDYLAGTSEVPVMGYHGDETIEKGMLPKKTLAFSPCFRREAGSHGKDTKGLIRVNEFYKIEQVVLCEASHEESVKLHEWINRNTEEFIESLGIPYRTVLNCGGDLGLGQVKKYDIELWVPLEETYREISSASYFHDFQTRRFNTKYIDKDGERRFAHSLNCTAIPTPRILVSLVENYQNEDGSVTIPEALRSYMGDKGKIENTNE